MPRPSREYHRYREKRPEPPRSYDSPSQAKQGRRLCVKNRRMKDCEVFNTYSCRKLVMDNPVEHRRNDAQN
jgi:hypothetical protein